MRRARAVRPIRWRRLRVQRNRRIRLRMGGPSTERHKPSIAPTSSGTTASHAVADAARARPTRGCPASDRKGHRHRIRDWPAVRSGGTRSAASGPGGDRPCSPRPRHRAPCRRTAGIDHGRVRPPALPGERVDRAWRAAARRGQALGGLSAPSARAGASAVERPALRGRPGAAPLRRGSGGRGRPIDRASGPARGPRRVPTARRDAGPSNSSTLCWTSTVLRKTTATLAPPVQRTLA